MVGLLKCMKRIFKSMALIQVSFINLISNRLLVLIDQQSHQHLGIADLTIFGKTFLTQGAFCFLLAFKVKGGHIIEYHIQLLIK